MPMSDGLQGSKSHALEECRGLGLPKNRMSELLTYGTVGGPGRKPRLYPDLAAEDRVGAPSPWAGAGWGRGKAGMGAVVWR
jgi:hypothetical protein